MALTTDPLLVVAVVALGASVDALLPTFVEEVVVLAFGTVTARALLTMRIGGSVR